MRVHPQNPDSNSLRAGVDETSLADAIDQSGYPLQSRVVDTILQSLEGRAELRAVQEEWSYVDEDEGHIRQLDALLSFDVEPLSESYDPGRPSNPASYLRGSLDFLVECKRSDLPFICFVRSLGPTELPLVGGLPHEELTIHEAAQDAGFMRMSASYALGCHELPLATADRTAIALTKAHRKGKALELSGEEAFRALALPLLKATSYYLEEIRPGPGRLYFDVRAIVPIAVVDAPLVAVHMEAGRPSLEAVPWVRLVRHEPGERRRGWPQVGVRAFDIVHVDFLSEYATRALGSASVLIERARCFAPQLLTGHARWDATSSVVDEDAARDDAPYLTFGPHQTTEDFAAWIDERWRTTHAAPQQTE